MKKRLIFLGCILISVLINVIILFIFKDKFIHREHVIASWASFVSLLLMIAMVIIGILSYFYRRKDNFLSLATPRKNIMIIEKNCTYTEEQRRDFFWKFILFWFIIPFYIPCIIFSTKDYHCLWALALVAIPQIVYFNSEITIPVIKKERDRRKTRLKEEAELSEQQKRESEGKFK